MELKIGDFFTDNEHNGSESDDARFSLFLVRTKRTHYEKAAPGYSLGVCRLDERWAYQRYCLTQLPFDKRRPYRTHYLSQPDRTERFANREPTRGNE